MGRKKREFVDLTGQMFGRWEVLGLAEPKVDSSGREYETWTCRCSCEKHTIKDVYVQHLIHGNSQSCGCMRDEITGNNFRTHGKTETRLYNIWCMMKARCYKPSNHAYARYGGSGITICDEWHNFSTFEKWAIENGYNEHLTIDRIDNDLGYSPENCRWATYKEQANNTSKTIRLTVDGQTKTASEWSDVYGVPLYEIRFRLKHGWTPEEAVKIPLHHKRKEIAS